MLLYIMYKYTLPKHTVYTTLHTISYLVAVFSDFVPVEHNLVLVVVFSNDPYIYAQVTRDILVSAELLLIVLPLVIVLILILVLVISLEVITLPEEPELMSIL